MKDSLGLGLMSGTSLDGLDLALCRFRMIRGKVNYQILDAQTVSYSNQVESFLKSAHQLSARDFLEFNVTYGQFLAKSCNQFIKKTKVHPHFIASHGHTIFHEPVKGFTTQIGCGATIAANTGLTTICDFRSLDVALKGQGAPLVPIGDELLFGDFAACLNIGGIANISFKKNGKRIAYDIAIANIALNYLCQKLSLPYDKNGLIARENGLDLYLLSTLNQLPYYTKKGAKSLGREDFEKSIQPLVNKLEVKNAISTFTHHLAEQIALNLNKHKIPEVLCTGGGTHNQFLIELIQAKTQCRLIVPDRLIIDFKEALIFALLGYLRLNGQTNTLKSVTGARRNSVGGAVYSGR